MSYSYKTERENIFTEEGQKMFLKIRDKSKALLGYSGAFSMEKVIQGCVGNSWHMLACVDRLVELGEIKEITGQEVSGQNRIFVRKD